MIFHLNGDTVRIGWVSGSKCPYLWFNPDNNKVRVEFPDEEYNIMLPNGWHRYRSMPGMRELEIDRGLIEPFPAASVSFSWGSDDRSHDMFTSNTFVFDCDGGTTNSVGCKTITIGNNSFVSSNATLDDSASVWTIFASVNWNTELESPEEKKLSKPNDDWEEKAKRRTDDNLRKFFGE